MTYLGEFGTTRPEVDLAFGYFGATIRVNPNLSELVLVDLFAGMAGGEDGTEALTAITGMVDALVHPEDVPEFRTRCRANRQSTEDLAQLAVKLVEALTDRPTRQPADSSDGLPTTVTNSEDDSRSAALKRLEGRPDLQVAVLRASA